MRFSVGVDGIISWPGREAECALGRGGICAPAQKREGDGRTPAGDWPIRRVLWRPDRGEAPQTALPVIAIAADDGWCDDPSDRAYNRPVKLPYPASAEQLWRDDAVYDLIVELGYNDDPVITGAGSAIFLHVARPDRSPTEGCVALDQRDLRDLLRLARPGDSIAIALPSIALTDAAGGRRTEPTRL